jgi:ribosome biogenesis GTPase
VTRGDWRALDESDVRTRPNPRGSRPRTKRRPEHASAVPALVIRTDRGRYTAVVEADGEPARAVTAMKARELGRASIVVGDQVFLVGDVSGQGGTLGRIVKVAPRQNVLRRSADDADPTERVIVANADQLAVVAALADPPPRRRLIDRCLVAAYDAGMDACLILTKDDLPDADPDELAALYRPLGVKALATGRGAGGKGTVDVDGLERVRQALAGRVTVLVGHSGVGKSTLVNALVPGAERTTGDVNDVTGRGRHTSTSVMALALPGGGWVIDTPGIRSFGLGHVRPERLFAAFGDVAEAAKQCPRGCTHLADAPDCCLDEWAGDDPGRWSRLDSIRRLWSSRADAASGLPSRRAKGSTTR